jgi:hypothetical protein
VRKIRARAGALMSPNGTVVVAAEFKYEPSYRRGDIPRTWRSC